MQNGLFAQQDFIDASRDFVCVRIETFENKESEKMVREVLGGKFANTSFCVFNPQGTKKLSRGGRSPTALQSGRPNGKEVDADELIAAMKKIANRYKPSEKKQPLVLQDFNSMRQALNVASADQRLLVFVNADKKQRAEVEKSLQAVFEHKDIVGKFHLNFVNEKVDKGWEKKIKDATAKPGIVIVQSGKFGVDGLALAQLPLDSTAGSIKDSLLAANKKFGSIEKRKTYSEHVQSGRRKGIYFENEIEYGEDRDGDGEIDKKKTRRRGRG